jgi:hypothetical protein
MRRENTMAHGFFGGSLMRMISIAAALALSAVAAAAAANPLDNHPEARAYFSVGFDGPRESMRPLSYGLRIDHDRRYAAHRQLPPLMQLEFSRQGFDRARLNGVPFMQRQYRLNQAPGDELRYTVFDWGLLVVGAVGLGLIIAEIADGENDPDPNPTEDGNGNGNGNGDDNGNGDQCLPGTDLCLPMMGAATAAERELIPAYQSWLDAGSGQMGDLYD